jgi:glycosyltransferase involved in cell wall biosynthesis
MSTAAAILPCRALGIPLVDGSIRSGMLMPRRGRLQAWILRFADAAIANSRAGLEAYGVREERGHVVHNAFDPARWRLCERGGEPPAFDAVMAGRFVRDKDFRSYLDAARLLRNRDPRPWRFAAVGSGDDELRLREEYADLIADGTAVLIDARTEILPVVIRAAVGVLLTDPRYHAEGISNAIMEYMACGLPVVCSDSGGNREIVASGVTGSVLDPATPEAVAAAVRQLRDNPDLAHAYGFAGRERIRQSFAIDSLVNGTIRVYRSVGVGR